MIEPYSKFTPQSHRYTNYSYASYNGADAWEKDIDPYDKWDTVYWVDRLDGFKNPKWYLQMIRGENASTPMSAYSWKVLEHVPGVFQLRYNIDGPGGPIHRRVKSMMRGGTTSAVHINGLNTAGIPTGTAENDAAGDWYDTVRDRMSTFKGSVFSAEARQAKRMMYERASKMLTMIPIFQDRLRKRWVRSKTKRGKLKTLSNSWLELQFGWGPLVSDIEDLYKILHDPTPMYKKCKGEGVCITSTNNPVGVGGAGGISYDNIVKVDTRYYVKYVGSIRARATPAGSRLLDFGFGVREFLPTLWEVIPWSFAIDYFTNISSLVNAASYYNVHVNWACKTVTRTRTYNRQTNWRSAVTNGSQLVDLNIASKLVVESKNVVRSVPDHNQVPFPSLAFERPGWKQILNLTALAVSKRLRLSY